MKEWLIKKLFVISKTSLVLACLMLLFCVFFASFVLFQKSFLIKSMPKNLFVNKPFVGQPLVAVAPHHNLVSAQRVLMWQLLSRQSQPKTIILLSPNHFNSGDQEIITTEKIWLVKNGQETIKSNATIIDALVKNGLAFDQAEAFDNEHGIKNLLGEIKQFFPKSDLVPIIIKDIAKPETIARLDNFLFARCQDCGVIASVDMSHYQPANLAEVHDIKTIRALTNLDEKEIWQTEVDSNASLSFLIAWAKKKNLNNFHLFNHTNSGFLAKDYDSETTTHIFGYYSDKSAGMVAQDNSATFMFAGDAMFGRFIGNAFQKNNFQDLFSNFGNRVFWGADISWLNLEGPISSKEVKQSTDPNDLSFNFSKEALEALKYLKLTTIGLANNHTFNQGKTGLEKTRQLLAQASIDSFGHPELISEQTVRRYDNGKIKISLLAINALEKISGLENLISQEHQQGRFVIVLPHWGNEYQIKHSAAQEKMARAWFKAGADLIIGSHPHVVQDAQIIDNKLVFYSLGNFVFDQRFSYDVQHGLLLAGVLEKNKIKIILLPIQNKDLKPEMLRGQEKENILKRVCQNISKDCLSGVIEILRE
ncbi:MAG: AmmeMemoRadiSam system protein B [bacterium]|nr:AmmeMemoRadiSam system protein B [bacterium]